MTVITLQFMYKILLSSLYYQKCTADLGRYNYLTLKSIFCPTT
jgi:hypothetical protein